TLRTVREPGGLRYERARSAAGGPSVVLLPGLFAGGWLWDVTWRRLVKLGVDVIRLLDPLAARAETAGDPAAFRSPLERLVSERRHWATALRTLKAARAYDARAALARVACPVLMVWGAEDRATPPHAWERAARELPRCEFHMLPDCGHSPMLERPDAFTDLLLAF